MRQVLFHIPLDRPWSFGPLGPVPGFGFGAVLLVWVLLGAWMVVERRKERDRKFDADDLWSLARWLVGAAVIAFGAPLVGAYLRANGSPHFRDGLPIFGYGFMLFLGMASAIGLATWRAEREGVPGDLIWDMAFCLFVAGIAGGRLFYLVQKRDEVFSDVNSLRQFLYAAIMARGPWRTSGEWWRDDAWNRDEWDVALECGSLYRLFSENDSRRWFMEGTYD